MPITIDKKAIAKELQAQINTIQGLGKIESGSAKTDLSPFTDAFPNRIFPMGTLHEFISYEPAHAASTSGFITALAGKFLNADSLCVWIGSEIKAFASGIKNFGIEPDRIIFIHAPKHKDALWIIEEVLKCEALTAVIAEIKELGFTESRRLQLAVERSGVTCFIHRYQPNNENAVACTTRWKIIPFPSTTEDNLPGVGHSSWAVHLLKVRNGKPGSWHINWLGGKFVSIADQEFSITIFNERHTG